MNHEIRIALPTIKTCVLALLAVGMGLLPVRADNRGVTESESIGSRDRVFKEAGPARCVLVGVEVYLGRFFSNDVVHGIRPIFLDSLGRELNGNAYGKCTGPAKRLRAKKGYAVGALSARSGLGIDGLSLTFMKIDKGRLDAEQSYESEWAGGKGGGQPRRVGGSGDVVIGIFGSQNHNGELNGVGLLLSDRPIVSAPTKKPPVPDDAALAKALQTAREVYGPEFAGAKSANQKRELALKIIKAADESEGDLPARFVLLRLARDIAAQAADGLTAFEAIDKLAEQFQVNDLEMKMAVLTSLAKRAKAPAEHKSIGDQAAGLIEAAIARDDVDLAVKLCDLAMPEARASHDADLLREVKNRSEQCRGMARALGEMKAAAAVLEKQPDDPAANLTVGKYHCFQKGDWEKGISLLARSGDPALKAAAALEVAAAADPANQVKAGDAWWDLAEKEQGKAQAALRARAIHWYQQALPEISGLAKAKAEKRVREFEAAGAAPEEKKSDTLGKRPAKYLPGLVAQYYDDTRFNQRVKVRVDPNIDFNWGSDSPDPAMKASEFGARWIGYIKVPKAGRYVIHVRSHGESQVMLDNAMVINNRLSPHRDCEQQAEVNLTAGYHLVAVQFVHAWGQANCHLGWQPPGATGWTAIPAQSLFHDQKQEQAAGLGGR